jgi:hypothetical protein
MIDEAVATLVADAMSHTVEATLVYAIDAEIWKRLLAQIA